VDEIERLWADVVAGGIEPRMPHCGIEPKSADDPKGGT